MVGTVRSVTIKHKLINCMHDEKERLAAITAKLEEDIEQGMAEKKADFGEQNKICLTPQKTPTTILSLSTQIL